ncbi:hypothetical protein LTR91_024253 [Friedmanniomyces endolithicus]|uniref:WSC domain-containing protein n=1 Tax=Friedmanniomyces endolithicus TaxID=329885 RepID=A0AAN6JX10_9PEZI|nr:hypothetical protein LTR91_024253 [Friedmanniomyces endolithicus]
MRPSIARTTALAASLALAAHALDGLTVPSSIAADTEFQATFQNGNSDNYRVYLAASLAGTNGPTYLADLSPSSNSPATYSYSNHFALTASNGNYTPYEQHLGGAPFWDANALPCSSYACARQCAQAGFPGDLSDQGAWEVMKGCILGCAGVEPAVGVTGPALASSGSGTGTGTTSSVSASGTGTETGAGGGGVGTATRTADEVLVTLLPGVVMTAVETTATISGSAVTEAVLGSVTLTLGGAEATVSGKAVSLASSGVEVGGSTTVAFSSAVQTFATTTSSGQAGSASETGAAPAATSSAGAARGREVAMVGIAGVAGLAVMLF